MFLLVSVRAKLGRSHGGYHAGPRGSGSRESARHFSEEEKPGLVSDSAKLGRSHGGYHAGPRGSDSKESGHHFATREKLGSARLG